MHARDVGTPFASRTKRIVVVADNSLIVDALRVGLRKSGEFNLVGMQTHAGRRRPRLSAWNLMPSYSMTRTDPSPPSS